MTPRISDISSAKRWSSSAAPPRGNASAADRRSRLPIRTPLAPGNYTIKPPPQFATFSVTVREAARVATMAGAGSFSASAPPTH
jgi:hypothetical protein